MEHNIFTPRREEHGGRLQREREREGGRRRERERKRKSGWMGVRRSWGGGRGERGERGGREGWAKNKGQPGTLYQFVCAPFEGRERRVRCKCYN